MTTVTNIRPAAPTLPEIVGYVEALTADRLLGWAWAPTTPETRVVIELRSGDTVIAKTVANLARADLAANGVGDGRHAFDVEIPDAFRSRTAELRVFARAGDNEAMPIGAPPAAEGLSDQVTKLLRGVDMLLNSQRLLHRNLQTALTDPKDAKEQPIAAMLTQMAEVQAVTVSQLSAIERFVIRLDDHLSKLVPEDVNISDHGKQFPLAARWALGLAGLALGVSIAGLVRSLGGF